MTPQDSAALKFQSEHYPLEWAGRVPSRVKVTASRGVRPDGYMGLWPEYRGLVCLFGEEYDAECNSHGAVAAIFPDGRVLGLRPNEFEIIAWHEVTS